MPTVLVTGNAGFIGSHLTERLLALGHSVVGFDNFDPFYDPAIKRKNLAIVTSHPHFTFVEGDLRRREQVDALFAGCRIDRIFHGAARAGVRPSLKDPLLYEEVNVRGTLHLLEAATRHRVDNFVFASSSSVYGEQKKVPFSETDPVDHPISPYAATKKACELMCFTYHHLYSLPTTCLRFFTVYGPRQRPEMAIHAFTRAIERGEPLKLFGDGSARRDFTYIDDIIAGVTAALDRPHPYEVINLGESQTIALRDLIARLEQLLGKRANIQALPAEPGDVPITYADVSKARALLDYNPSTPVEDGLARFVAWYRTTAGSASRKDESR
ncbi:MAG TPA: NAD-dependent epimerase/dehydratase family protein [Nitrospiria bacterium]|nr:NAD-dependent epimerase/dehydratase family protein [Nitrospiria bacterium]